MKQIPYRMTVIIGALAVFLALAAPGQSGAQEIRSFDLSSYAPPALFNPQLTIIPPPLAKPVNTWEAIKVQFEKLDPSTFFMLDPIIYSKNAMDVSLFSVVELATRLSGFLELRYNRGHIGRPTESTTEPTSTRWHDSLVHLEDARLKFACGSAWDKPYVGLKIVLPFGKR